MTVTYITRDGTKIDGTTGQDHLLEVIYGHALTRMLLRPFLSPAVSDICGKFLSTRLSRRIIPSFVKKNHIDLGIYEKQEFDSYNAFFTRKIKAEQRPINDQKNVLISPSDGKVTAYPITQKGRFWIKHTQYSAAQLLKDERLAERYMGGWIYVIRLTVDDYHRYCYVADGRKSRQRKIRGVLHTVNPVANDYYPIYKMNSREYCLLKTKELGTILLMEVGALMVGKISNHEEDSAQVKRGDEKGMFEFGGSTIVVMTEPGMAEPDKDIIHNTKAQAETLVKMGEPIGCKYE
ncbi:phosphatidylserine decarboxylase [Dorea formicigenerans]|uniref:Phosphatidylserine decarboxylase n=1 Tax=Dorea formicigenerans TaxID=39486 RepID=A0A415UFA8_9FIRM|nr:phosphatidylserine decarboxylase [Dorea formicigenerans]RHN16770.1 phosphatidylserine decarboxylase [Dorea formicigenerans]